MGQENIWIIEKLVAGIVDPLSLDVRSYIGEPITGRKTTRNTDLETSGFESGMIRKKRHFTECRCFKISRHWVFLRSFFSSNASW